MLKIENIPQKYLVLKIFTLATGIVLYITNYLYITRIAPISFVSYLFGDTSLFVYSLPLVLILLFLMVADYYMMVKQYRIANIAFLILIAVDLFSFPVGTIITLFMMLITLRQMDLSIFYSRATIAMILPVFLIPLILNFIPSDEPVAPLALTMAELGENETVQVIVELTQPRGVQQQSLFLQDVQLLGATVQDRTLLSTNSVLLTINKSALPMLVQNPNVKQIVPNGKVHLFLDNSYMLLGVDNLWRTNHTGKGIVVAVVDSGINDNIPALMRNGKSVVIDNYDEGYYTFHGTAVACCIASQDKVFRGIAPDVDIIDVPVFRGESTDYWSILKGWEWVVKWKLQHPDTYLICTNSFGSTDTTALLLNDALNNMVLTYNIPMVVSSGNSAGPVNHPGDAKYAFTVGAVDDTNEIAWFSCYGNEVDVVAYGVNVHMFDESGNRITASGTSFSTPMVTGCLALIAEKYKPSATKLYDVVRATATDLGPTGFDQHYGYGLINTQRAIQMLSGEPQTSTATENVKQVYLLSMIPAIPIGLVVRRKYV